MWCHHAYVYMLCNTSAIDEVEIWPPSIFCNFIILLYEYWSVYGIRSNLSCFRDQFIVSHQAMTAEIA